MKEERMAILKMLEDGKINTEEAVKLIDTINSASTVNKANDIFSSVKKKVSKMAKDAEPKVRAVASVVAEKSVEMGNSFKQKIDAKIAESKYKDQINEAREKAEEFAKDAMEEVEDFAEKVDKKMNESKYSQQYNKAKDKAEEVVDKAKDFFNDNLEDDVNTDEADNTEDKTK